MFPGVFYEKSKKDKDNVITRVFERCKYWVPQTVGYYQLRNTLAKVTDPFNMYMFVSDANAPLLSYETAPEDNADWWAVKENALMVSNSIFLPQEARLINDIGECELPEDIGKALYRCWYGNSKWENYWNKHQSGKSGVISPNWQKLFDSNYGYHAQRSVSLKLDGKKQIKTPPEGINMVFGSGFVNPYTSNNVVIAKRARWEPDFLKKEGKYWNKDTRGEDAYNKKDGIPNYPIKPKDMKNLPGYLFIMGLPPEHTGLT